MAKFYGAIGYAETVEVAKGSWQEVIRERKYYGDVTRYMRKLESGGNVNDNVTTNNVISIIADAEANEHCFAIRYAEWLGTKWKVVNVEVSSPRLILTLGGVYKGPTEWPTRGAV